MQADEKQTNQRTQKLDLTFLLTSFKIKKREKKATKLHYFDLPLKKRNDEILPSYISLKKICKLS